MNANMFKMQVLLKMKYKNNGHVYAMKGFVIFLLLDILT